MKISPFSLKSSWLKGAFASLALLAGTPALSETRNAVVPLEEKAAPALWQVADEDTTIYLFGTVHFLPPDLDWYGGEVAQALEASGLIVKELGPDAFEPAPLQAAVVKHALMPQGQTVRSLMTDEQRSVYEAELKALGMPEASLDPFQPWFAAVRITVAKFQQIGFSAGSGVETVLEQKAADTPRAGLETIDYQFGLFASLPMDEQVKYLMETVGEMENIEPALKQMVESWRTGDADGLAELMNAALAESDLAGPLLYTRNEAWAQWIKARLETPGTVFIAVGAGHLAGEKSVQDLLEAQDVDVARIQ